MSIRRYVAHEITVLICKILRSGQQTFGIECSRRLVGYPCLLFCRYDCMESVMCLKDLACRLFSNEYLIYIYNSESLFGI